MSYTKTNWTSTTPINTSNLNKIENGISANDTAIEELANLNIELATDLTGNETDKAPSVKAVNDGLNSIVQSGEGYVKYSDGTMICYGNFNTTKSNSDYWTTLYISGSITINFPVSFISNPVITSMLSNNHGAISCIYSSIGTSSFTFAVLKAKGISSGTHTNCTGNWQAIGKWK